MKRRQMRGQSKGVLTLLFALVFASAGVACAKQRESKRVAANAGPVHHARGATKPASKGTRSLSPPTRSEVTRKVIHRAQFHISVKKYEPFAVELRGQLKQFGGYMGELQISRSVRRISSVQAKIRVPSERFEAFLLWIRKNSRVTFERMSGEDITARYYDLKSRLRNLKRLEKRMLELLKSRTAKLQDIIHVERELARVRGKIERMEGQRKLWDRLVAMATLRLRIHVEERYQPIVALSFGQKLGRSFTNSWSEFGAFLKNSAIGVVQIFPWLLFYGLLFLIGRGLWRRRKAKAAAQAA